MTKRRDEYDNHYTKQATNRGLLYGIALVLVAAAGLAGIKVVISNCAAQDGNENILCSQISSQVDENAVRTRVAEEAILTSVAQATQAADEPTATVVTITPELQVPDTPIVVIVTATPTPTTEVTVAIASSVPTHASTSTFTLSPPVSTNIPVSCLSAPIPANAFAGVTHNVDWTIYECDFNGVNMLLVPAGCFMMGSEQGDNDERPVQQQCFDKPFWIDKYEVTNSQYGSEGSLTGGNRPRIDVSWTDAKRYCESKGEYLPTEAEWEYAARGPDDLIYPWGNTFNAEYSVNSSNSNTTYPIGSKPNGISWIGAYDLIGNVWEWTSTLERLYPYDASDGREDPNILDFPRILRGGAFTDDNVRASERGSSSPSEPYFYKGFRCARIYQ